MLKIVILTIFPRLFDSFLEFGNPARAIGSGRLEIRTIDIREYSTDKHRMVDDYPYGGGPGMVMKPEPIVSAIKACCKEKTDREIILTSPQGLVFSQDLAEELVLKDELVFVCGRYEGIDERVCAYVDRELSVGDFVLSGGEAAVMVMMDAIIRLIPGVMGSDSHILDESFYNGLLEYPQYTRPRVFEGRSAPDVLLEGHHEKIKIWRKKQALARTLARRPDLLKKRKLNSQEKELLKDMDPEFLEQYNESFGSD
jgi:tRNA (guanine37-N1)-methyltransferase